MCELLINVYPILLLLQLEDGDIICFQRAPQVGSSEQCRYPDVPSFLEYVHNRQVFQSLCHVTLFSLFLLYGMMCSLSLSLCLWIDSFLWSQCDPL